MDLLTNNLTNLSFVSIVPVIILFLKNAVDSFNMKTVERVILTDSKKIGVFLSQIILISLPSGLIVFVLFIIQNNKSRESEVILLNLSVSLIAMFLFMMVSVTIVLAFTSFFSIKVNFFVLEKDTMLEWKIERRVNKINLLVSREENIYKFFELNYVMKQEIIRKLEYKESYKIPLHDGIIKNSKVISLLLIILIVGLLTLILFVGISVVWKIVCLLILIVTYFIALYMFIVFNNDKVLSMFGEESQRISYIRII